MDKKSGDVRLVIGASGGTKITTQTAMVKYLIGCLWPLFMLLFSDFKHLRLGPCYVISDLYIQIVPVVCFFLMLAIVVNC